MALYFKTIFVILVIFTIGLSNVNNNNSQPLNNFKEFPGIHQYAGIAHCEKRDTIKIASFNIQIFGRKKASHPGIMGIIAMTISQFDIIALQEIRDASGLAIEALEQTVDKMGNDYDYTLSPRLGRTSCQEQYAYMYRTASIIPSPAENSYTFDDSMDIFHRDPFISRFKSIHGNFDFIIIQIHVDPDMAYEEIEALTYAVADVQKKYPDEKDMIILGDLNADCTYWNENLKPSTIRSDEYLWLIDNAQDTTISNSSCAYDRIIISRKATLNYFTGKAGVYRFDKILGLNNLDAKKVSDHYPVWAEFNIYNDFK